MTKKNKSVNEGNTTASGKKRYGEWAITYVDSVKFDDYGAPHGGKIRLTNQKTGETLLIQNDLALRGSKWFISTKGRTIKHANPEVVIKKAVKLQESVNESMSKNEKLKIYNNLKKGDTITIEYGTSIRKDNKGTFVVTKGKTVVGKQKVERITLQSQGKKGVKYYLYNRNGNVTMAVGNSAASIQNMSESVNELKTDDSKVISGLRTVVLTNNPFAKFKDHQTGKKIPVSPKIADAIVSIYDKLTGKNKEKFADLPIHKMIKVASNMVEQKQLRESALNEGEQWVLYSGNVMKKVIKVLKSKRAALTAMNKIMNTNPDLDSVGIQNKADFVKENPRLKVD